MGVSELLARSREEMMSLGELGIVFKTSGLLAPC
jgi:hypothetical protein